MKYELTARDSALLTLHHYCIPRLLRPCRYFYVIKLRKPSINCARNWSVHVAYHKIRLLGVREPQNTNVHKCFLMSLLLKKVPKELK